MNLTLHLLVSFARAFEPDVLPALFRGSPDADVENKGVKSRSAVEHLAANESPDGDDTTTIGPALGKTGSNDPAVQDDLSRCPASAESGETIERDWTPEQCQAGFRWLSVTASRMRADLTATARAAADLVQADREMLALEARSDENVLADRFEAFRKAAAESEPTVGLASAHTRPLIVEPLSPELEQLRAKIHQVLALYRNDRLLNTANQSPWEVMHRIVAYGIPTEIRRDGPTGDRVNAIGWLLYGGRCAGQPLLMLSNDRPVVVVGPGVQGHTGQLVAMLAQSHVSPNTPFKLSGKTLTVHDLIEEEKLGCEAQTELTFKLIALSYYLKSDDEWMSRDGQNWSISRLVQEEIRAPIRGAACGGTHRLFGLSSAYKMRIRDGFPVDGQFKRAQTYIRDYQRYTLGTLRNFDGSFSTDWFTRRADSGDKARKLQTTGHILEWLVFSLDQQQLRDPRVVQTVDFLATMILNDPDRDWSVGPLGHALHALSLYDERLFRREAGRGRFSTRRPLDTALARVAKSRFEPGATHRASCQRHLGTRSRPRPVAVGKSPGNFRDALNAAQNVPSAGRSKESLAATRKSPYHATRLSRILFDAGSTMGMKTQRLTDQFQKIIDLAGRLAGLVAADALLVLLEGPTDWEQFKILVGDGKVLVAADIAEQLEGAAGAGLATVVLNMADSPVYEKLTQALLESVADEILAPGARVVAMYSGFESGVIDSISVINLNERLERLTARDLRQLETHVPLDTLKTVVDLAVEVGREDAKASRSARCSSSAIPGKCWR